KGLRKFLALNVAIRAGIREFLYGIDRRLLERLVGHRRPRESDNCEPPRQAILRRQAKQRRNQLPPRKIAGGAEDDDRAGVRGQDRAFPGGFHGFGNAVFAWRHGSTLTFLRPLLSRGRRTGFSSRTAACPNTNRSRVTPAAEAATV